MHIAVMSILVRGASALWIRKSGKSMSKCLFNSDFGDFSAMDLCAFIFCRVVPMAAAMWVYTFCSKALSFW